MCKLEENILIKSLSLLDKTNTIMKETIRVQSACIFLLKNQIDELKYVNNELLNHTKFLERELGLDKD